MSAEFFLKQADDRIKYEIQNSRNQHREKQCRDKNNKRLKYK